MVFLAQFCRAFFIDPKIQLNKKNRKLWPSFVPYKFKSSEMFILLENKNPWYVYPELFEHVLAWSLGIGAGVGRSSQFGRSAGVPSPHDELASRIHFGVDPCKYSRKIIQFFSPDKQWCSSIVISFKEWTSKYFWQVLSFSAFAIYATAFL